MYRICLARSGSYYVQRNMGSPWHDDWVKVGGFFPTKSRARRWVSLLRGCPVCPRPQRAQVVEYV